MTARRHLDVSTDGFNDTLVNAGQYIIIKFDTTGFWLDSLLSMIQVQSTMPEVFK